MSFIVSIVVSFFLSLKGITNKELLISQNNTGDQIVSFRYIIALGFTLILYYFFPNENNTNIMLICLMFLITVFDFLGSYFTQKYTKSHPNSSFQNFLGSFIPIAYIPIGVLFLGENFGLYDFIGLSLIIFSLSFFTKFKELNFYSPVLFVIILGRLFNIYLIGKYINLGGYFLELLIFIYIFVLWGYFLKFFIKKYEFQKINKINCLDALFFSVGSIGSFFLYELFQSYEVKLFLLSTFIFNVILFKIFYDEKYFYKKLFLSFIIILGIIIIGLK